ncbi:MAG: NAD(P)H-dependent oxidoreductase [Bdellovibrionales bacterium]|nr:NAD(P)H-dependent oxidoreductase [Bdellovibrionales bacterium]
MKTMLLIQCSPAGTHSLSRQITTDFLHAHKSRHGDRNLIIRDLVQNPPPHLSGEFVGAMFVPPNQRSPQMEQTLSLGAELAEEVKKADEIVISAPMYNRTVPSSLKAWIDHVVLPYETFSVGATGPAPLLKGKTLYLICATGGVYSTGPKVSEDFLTPYIKFIMGFMGIKDVRVVFIEGVAFDREQGLIRAKEQIKTILEPAV